ncbi:GNAT family N-acetyltransferase [Shewanella baltica]|uniref:GNAT family N-acetyltransferase n=1 Tax=Shewanella baltica TaxID=62322 RepID=UPI00217E7B15|nr:GNAT family N-acetyltransferase [Shewanella baltica]MCS6230568.1 GNAT family N-acetyltransferase [Shewanella baltica]
MSNPPPTVTIEQVKETDFSLWLPHWRDYQTFYKVALSEATTQTTWRRFFDRQEPLYCAVAREGENLLGFVHFVFHRSTWAETEYCYLEDLFVAPAARSKLVGKQLIEFVQQAANERDCARLYWHTHETNHTAQKLYDWIGQKSGMIEYQMPL